MFLHFSEGLFWFAFVERALERILGASAYATFRLLKAKMEGMF